MEDKIGHLQKLYLQTLRKLQESPTAWKKFLDTASRLYKYNFKDQVLLFAQVPDATACAEADIWSQRMKRWINRGEHGYDLLRSTPSGKIERTRVFDIAQTHKIKGGRDVFVWQLKDDYQEPVLRNLEEKYGMKTDTSEIIQRLMAIGKTCAEWLRCGGLKIPEALIPAVEASVQYVILRRCGFSPAAVKDSSFAFLTVPQEQFGKMGNAVNRINNVVLRDIEKNVKNILQTRKFSLENENQKNYNSTVHSNTLNRERDVNHGTNIQSGRRSGSGDGTDDRQGNGSGQFNIYANRRNGIQREIGTDVSEVSPASRERTDTSVASRQSGRNDFERRSGEKSENSERNGYGNSENNGGKAAQSVRRPAQTVSQGTETRIVRGTTEEGQAENSLVGNGGRSAASGQQHRGTDGTTEQRERSAKSKESNEVGTIDEQLSGGGAGNRTEQSGVQLNQEHKEAVGEQLPTASFTQAELSEPVPLLRNKEDHSLKNGQISFASLMEQSVVQEVQQEKSAEKAEPVPNRESPKANEGKAEPVPNPESSEASEGKAEPVPNRESPEANEGKAEPVPKTERVAQEPAHNYHIPVLQTVLGGQKTRYKNNVTAIQLMKTLESDGRRATRDEQEILNRYVGWGGLAQAFDAHNQKWVQEYAALKELLSDKEYRLARASTLNAHYTCPVVIYAIYSALQQMQVHPHNVLEPACGIGNFFGCLPEAFEDSKLYGAELDSITGRIARQLYQKADIRIEGFEKTAFDDNFFDLAVSNVPFGEYHVSDKRYDQQHFLIHDYFFAKTLDKVRPGGIIAFITSKGTLDKFNPEVRKYLAERADLLGAIRLPNNAFLQNAGTEVTSDILFFQKRTHRPEKEPEWITIGKTEDSVPVNQYFIAHPEMLLGKMSFYKNMYGNETETACLPIEGADLQAQLTEAISHLEMPNVEMLEARSGGESEFVKEELDSSIPAEPGVRNYSFTERKGNLYFRENSIMLLRQPSKTGQERISGLIKIRDIARNLITAQVGGKADAAIESLQEELNIAYDKFTGKYGLLSCVANRRAFQEDSSYPLLTALEVLDEDGNLERKSDMFTKRTIQPARVVTSVDTASEALAVSISEKARVDIPYMMQLTGFDEKRIEADLKGVIYRDLGDNEPQNIPKAFFRLENCPFVMADEYLSGNIRKKLRLAKGIVDMRPDLAAELQENIKALTAVMPKDLTAAEIDVRIGAPWITPQYYQQFLYELLNTPYNLQSREDAYYKDKCITVNYSSYTGEWRVTNASFDHGNLKAARTYGSSRYNAYAIFNSSLNQRTVQVFDTKYDEDGKKHRVLNGEETTIAQQKQDAIEQAFKDWVWKDPERRQNLCQTYNEQYNSVRPREYDGSHLHFVGMNPEIVLRQHQLNAVAHILYGDNTLLAHVVGAGKTYEMVAAAMESKRLGLCRKSLLVVPNHLIDQWGSEFLQLYPGANILLARKKDFEPANRKRFCARIATGDYDAVIIGHSQFEKIPLSPERQETYLQDQIDDIMRGIEEAKEMEGARFTVKQMERTLKNMQARLDKLNDTSRQDDVVTFEELGVDRLFVDEAHSYKNLYFQSKMSNVAGVGQSEAQKSSDMFMKCRYMDELTGGKGIIFATGTPISNSMVELYTMMRYLQFRMLKEHGFEHFDNWAAAFGEKVTAIELSPEGTGFRSKTRFARFYNLPELMRLWKETADIQTADMLKLPVPKADYRTIQTKPSVFQKEMVRELSKRADDVRNRKVNPTVDNMLRITGDGRKLALDQRLQNAMLSDFPDSKVNRCVDNIVQEWKDSTTILGTQLVFCDLSTPNKKVNRQTTENGTISSKFQNVYYDLKEKLVAKGIPETEIAFIHDAKTDAQKAELFAKVRKGHIRVLIGSTSKMGAGTNVQTRLVALHHLDCPWRPADLQQREGRILRQGNMNHAVRIYQYVTSGTFDAYNWSLVENKQKFIGQVMTSKTPARSMEDVDATALSYAEVKALATGDPRIKEKMDLDIQVAKLKTLKANHDSQKYEMEDRITKYYPQEIHAAENRLAGLKADEAVCREHPEPNDDFSIKIGNTTYTEYKTAGNALIDACKKLTPEKMLTVGEYRGFTLSVFFEQMEIKAVLKHDLSHIAELSTDAVGNMRRLHNCLQAIPENLTETKNYLDNMKVQLGNAKEEALRPFAQEEELAQKLVRLSLLNAELGKADGSDQKFSCPEAAQDENQKVTEYFFENYGISADVMQDVIEKGLLYEDTCHNAVFVGQDKEGNADFALKHTLLSGSEYQEEIEGGNLESGWFVTHQAQRLFVTDTPVEALTVMTMRENAGENVEDSDYLALCNHSDNGVLLHRIAQNPSIKEVVFAQNPDSKSLTDCCTDLKQEMPYIKTFQYQVCSSHQAPTHQIAVQPDIPGMEV